MARKAQEKKGIGAARMSHADLRRFVTARREKAEPPAIMSQSIRVLPTRPAVVEPPIVTTRYAGVAPPAVSRLAPRVAALRKRLVAADDIDQRAALVELCDIVGELCREMIAVLR